MRILTLASLTWVLGVEHGYSEPSCRTKNDSSKTQDKIKLIGIQVRVFDNFSELETERQCPVVQVKKKVCVSFIAPNRRRGSPSVNIISGVSKIWPEDCPAWKQRPSGSSPKVRTLTAVALLLEGDHIRTAQR